MPQLEWNQYEFIECLEAIPVVEEDELSHGFAVIRDGIVLELTVYQYDSQIELSLRRQMSDDPITDFVLVVRGAAKIVRGPNRTECLQFTDCVIVPPGFSYGAADALRLDVHDPSRVWAVPAVRVFVNPSIRVEFLMGPRPL